MAAAVVVFLVLVKQVNNNIVVGNNGKQVRSSTRKASRKAKLNSALVDAEIANSPRTAYSTMSGVQGACNVLTTMRVASW